MDQEHNHENLMLSLELMRLMRWIAHNDPEALRKMIARALHRMPHAVATLTAHETENEPSQEDIVEFFVTMENVLFETLHQQNSRTAVQNHLIPAITRIDSSSCDHPTLQGSVERASAQLQQNPQENPRELFLKELLKRWKPENMNLH
jgi:hypothetical protein